MKLFIELNEYCARLAHTAARGDQSLICRLEEIYIGDRGDEQPLIDLVKQCGADAAAVRLVRPPAAMFHLASAEEARAHVTADAVRRFLASSKRAVPGTWQMALTSAGEGPIGAAGRAGRWLATAASSESIQIAKKWFREPEASQPAGGVATFALLNATRRLLKVGGQSKEVFVLELGKSSSTLLVTSSAGVEAVHELSFCFEHVVDAIAAELSLRMRGAAEKLWLNQEFDFSDSGARIAARLAEALLPAISEIQAGRDRATAGLFVAGLSTAQAWVGARLSESLGIPCWKPDVNAWMERAGFALDETIAGRVIEPEWLGVLGAAELVLNDNQSSIPCWYEASAAKKPGGEVVQTQADRAVQSLFRSEPGANDVARTPRGRGTPAFPRPLSAKSPPAPRKVGGVASSSVSGLPPVVPPAGSGDAPPTPSIPLETGGKRAGSKGRGIAGWLSLAAVAAVVGTLGTVYFRQVEQLKETALMEKAAAGQRAAADAEALRLAQLRAEEETQARRNLEARAAEQLALAEEARERAEAEALAREASVRRLLDARGSVRVATEPAGAAVAVGNYAPKAAPALIEDLRLGRYPVSFSLEGYDEVVSEVEIRENETTDLGVILLTKQSGTVTIDSIPGDVAFDLRPAGGRSFPGATETRQGMTPAVLSDLTPGEYVVTYLRDGWKRHSEKVVVENHGAASVQHRFIGAALKVTTDPADAMVSVNGVSGGSAPMVLSDLAPGELVIVVELAGYRSERIVRTAGAAELVDLSIKLELLDRIYGPFELDVAPQVIYRVQPRLNRTEQRAGRRILVSFDVNQNGIPENMVVLEAPDEESARRCLEAVQDWRFTPALVGGRPVRTKVNMPFLIH